MVILILTLLTLPAVWQLIIAGHFQPHDLHHLADIYEMTRAFSGQFPPRWTPDFTGGSGYPLFNFYYVLPFYLGSLFYVLLGSLTQSLMMVFLVCFIVSVWGMYRLLREFTGKWASVVGAIIFTYTPYRAVQIYVRGAVGEAMALALLPVVSYFLVKLVKNPNNKNIGLASISLALFISTHNYMWFLSLPFVYILLLLLVNKKQLVQSIKSLVFASILGLGTVAYWVFPAIFELKHVPRLTPFLLEDHFPFMKQLVIPSWGYGASHWGPYDDLSFQIGLVNLVVISLLGIIFLFKFKNLKREHLVLSIWIFVCFAISVLFMNIRTIDIWKLLPIYNFVQFPWRLLYLTTFFTSIAGALVIELMPKSINKKLAIILIFLCLLLTRDYFKPSGRFYKTDKEYLNLFFNDPNYSEDYLLLTQWTSERPTIFPKSKFEIQNGEVLDINEKTPINFIAKVKSIENNQVTFNSYYFPGWYAKVDGRSVNLEPSKPLGQILIPVEAGEHTIEVYWAETPFRLAMDVVSLASIVIILYLVSRKGNDTLHIDE